MLVFWLQNRLTTRSTQWKWLLLTASYIFYGWWDWRFCLLLGGSTIGNWLVGSLAASPSRQTRKTAVILAVVINIGFLGFFKYYDFFLEPLYQNFGSFFASAAISVALPIGISFITFQALSYVLDIYRNKQAPSSLLDFAVYLSFFPQLVAGPIIRASEFMPQLHSLPQRQTRQTTKAFLLIGKGLFKKLIVASYLSQLVDPVFAEPANYGKLALIVALYGFAIELYADFSGYTDMAIGLALLLGFSFPENFDSPYKATSLQDFWRRWHMTLSRWLKDYLYIPLGGSRKGPTRTAINIMIVMLLGGLWHGASFTFILWGGFHGIGLLIERYAPKLLAKQSTLLLLRWALPQSVVTAAKWWATFTAVSLAWVLFKAETFQQAFSFYSNIFTSSWDQLPILEAIVVIAVALTIQLLPKRHSTAAFTLLTRLPPPAQSAVFGIWLFLLVGFAPPGVDPFIYFRF